LRGGWGCYRGAGGGRKRAGGRAAAGIGRSLQDGNSDPCRRPPPGSFFCPRLPPGNTPTLPAIIPFFNNLQIPPRPSLAPLLYTPHVRRAAGPRLLIRRAPYL